MLACRARTVAPGARSKGSMLRPGDPLPELPLVTPRDRQVSLRTLAGEATALIFLRHLG